MRNTLQIWNVARVVRFDSAAVLGSLPVAFRILLMPLLQCYYNYSVTAGSERNEMMELKDCFQFTNSVLDSCDL